MKISASRGYVVSMVLTMVACRSEAPHEKPKADKPAAPAPAAPAPVEVKESSPEARAAGQK